MLRSRAEIANTMVAGKHCLNCATAGSKLCRLFGNPQPQIIMYRKWEKSAWPTCSNGRLPGRNDCPVPFTSQILSFVSFCGSIRIQRLVAIGRRTSCLIDIFQNIQRPSGEVFVAIFGNARKRIHVRPLLRPVCTQSDGSAIGNGNASCRVSICKPMASIASLSSAASLRRI